jgi:hypothetical protein
MQLIEIQSPDSFCNLFIEVIKGVNSSIAYSLILYLNRITLNRITLIGDYETCPSSVTLCISSDINMLVATRFVHPEDFFVPIKIN